MKNIREGLIPTVLGTAVTTAGMVMKQNRKIDSMISNTVFGFGLAHIVLGTIDLIEHRHKL
ncbi:asparagine synthase [Niallia sp. JL1B1071]|uniref:asparagine synthase n=1 Tax=Niallia tiangongensis TaxID=3237105 RepID=UPI0037DCD461